MKRGKYFAYYWVAILFVITFTGYAGILLPRHHKNSLFLFFGLFSLLAFKSEARKEDLIPATLLSSLCLFNMHTLWAPNPTLQALHIIVGIGVALQFIYNWNEEVRDIMFKGLGWLCILQSIWILCQKLFGIDLYFLVSGNPMVQRGSKQVLQSSPVVGSLGHWMVSASFLVMSYPFVWESCKKLLWLPILAAIALPSGVPIASLIVVTSCITVYMLRDRVWLVALILLTSIGIILAIYFNTSILDGSERFKIWKYAVLNFDVNPIIGNGTGYMRDFFERKFGSVFVEKHAKAHNDFVSTYIHFGLVGLTVLGYYIVRAFKGISREPLSGIALACCIVPMSVGFIFHIASTSVIFIIIIAALLYKNDDIVLKESL